MKKRTVKSSMSSKVVHVRLGNPPGATTGDGGPRREVKGLQQLADNEKEWNERRAHWHGALGVSSLQALNANVPDDAAPEDEHHTGEFDPMDTTDHTTENIVYMTRDTRFFRPFKHRYMRFVEPAIPFRRYDPRTWRDRIIARESAWARLMPGLVDTYLAWRDKKTPEEAAPSQDDSHYFEVSVVRAYDYIPRFRVAQDPDVPASVALVRAGLLPCVPHDPSIAISIDLLDLYYRLRRHAPRLGIQQFVKALCDRHERAYHRYLRDQFALTFDVYLVILREVAARVKLVLNRTEPDWRVKNSCPACRYKLADEPELVIPGFFAIDGNFSMKRSAAAGTAEPRIFNSDYKIDDEKIDLYANEVKTRTRLAQGADDDEPRVETLDEPGEPGDDAPPTPCTTRWKAAKADQHNIAPDMFDQTGIYVALCRHGLVLWFCEMRKSGELAKYPLGMFARILDAGLGPLTGAADIGCALQGTLDRSSIGDRAQAEGLRVRMNSFHGYGHNRLCQVTEHPLYIDGFGLEELETCERFFSGSNHVSGGVRHASHFHYLQFIDLFMSSWDDEKYAALSTFICNNIVQARQIIDDFEPVLEEFKSTRGLTNATIEGWRLEEKRYLESLKVEPEEDVLAMDYVEALRELEDIKATAEDARTELEAGFIVFNPEDLKNASRGAVAKRATKKKKSHAAYMAALANVESLERVLKIDVQWNPESIEYKAALEKIRLRDYMRTVDRLELLMLQRMFELAKTHAYGTGYKMREAIGKNIKSRSKAIATAVKNYNEAAQKLVPPAPVVNFSTLMEWTESQEFDLLRLARRGDVREREWAKPVNREAAQKHHKIKRAREELVRCEVELRRLVTSIRDEEAELDRITALLRQENHALLGEVERIRRRRYAVNAQHMARIAKLGQRPGLAVYVNACLVPGSREGGGSSGGRSDRAQAGQTSEDYDEAEEGSGDEMDDELAEQLLAVQDYIGQLES